MKIRELREECNLTQTQLGKIIGQSKSNISKYENEILEPGLQVLKSLSSFFNVSIDYILGNSSIRKIEAKNVENPTENLILKKIENLSSDSKKELEKYIDLLNLKDGMDKTKNEISSTLGRNILWKH